MKPLGGRDGACWPGFSAPELPVAVCDAESGDIEGAPAGRPSLEDPGDEASGLAIRSPPRDWARLKSPSMMASYVNKEGVYPGTGSLQGEGDTQSHCPGWSFVQRCQVPATIVSCYFHVAFYPIRI